MSRNFWKMNTIYLKSWKLRKKHSKKETVVQAINQFLIYHNKNK